MTLKPTKTKGRQRRLPVERATYTVDELSILLGRGRFSVYEDLREGRIPSKRLGNKFIISRSVIHKWLDSAEDAA